MKKVSTERKKSVFFDLDFWILLFTVTGIIIFLKGLSLPDEKTSLTFLGINPYKVKEDILNHYKVYPSIILSILGIIVQIIFTSRSKKTFKQRLRPFTFSLLLAIPLSFFCDYGLNILAKKEYFPKMLNLQKEVVEESIKQIQSNGTINAQNLPAEKIGLDSRAYAINQAKENLLVACDTLEVQCNHDTKDRPD